jgi:hypothetical protein
MALKRQLDATAQMREERHLKGRSPDHPQNLSLKLSLRPPKPGSSEATGAKSFDWRSY